MKNIVSKGILVGLVVFLGPKILRFLGGIIGLIAFLALFFVFSLIM